MRTWVDVDTAPYDVDASVTPDNPQYTVELMGTGPSENNLDLNANADYANYGNPYPPDNVAYYRVTARSSNPTTAGDRSVVVLQTTVKRSFRTPAMEVKSLTTLLVSACSWRSSPARHSRRRSRNGRCPSPRNVPGNLLLVPSVEWPTVDSMANLGAYDVTREYVGYFDAGKVLQVLV